MAAFPPKEAELTPEERLSFLQERGVEVDLTRGAHGGKVPAATGPPFSYVHIPQEGKQPVRAFQARSGDQDVLRALLAPHFANDKAMDEKVVQRESLARLKGMLVGGGGAGGAGLVAPSAATLSTLAASGACEAYPLCMGKPENGFCDVKLYIDEVGALRGLGRSARAETLAAAAGLTGLSIHGDAFVGRCERGKNTNFSLEEMSPASDWCAAARAAHQAAAAERGHGGAQHLATGGDEAGTYTWSQTEDEVEVRVRGAPSGKGAAKRVRVEYGNGESLIVAVDGDASAPLVHLTPLFARVDTGGCTWTLDGEFVVVSMEKAETRPWAAVTLRG